MKISYQWLKEFFPGVIAAPRVIAERLTNAGLEVEAVEELGKPFQNVVVAEVRSKTKHPNADRLSVCEVFNGKETLQIVCGAPNVTVGKKYPLAQIGASLPNGVAVQKATLRGVESLGMLCSAVELKLAEEKTGLMELPDEAKIGTALAKALGLQDTLLEINVTPNRGDCLSHRGIAREVGALFGRKLLAEGKKGVGESKEVGVKVELKDRKGCLRYCSRVIRGVKIAPSPFWLSQRLTRLGIRPINNVVDATNYVMLKLGHPTHAFDHRFLRGGALVIRKAGAAQKFKTLDGEMRELLPDDLVIADREGPVALAGIIGGAESEIRQDTSVVVLEAAAFDPVRIRRTARRLSIQTESSLRFERGVPAASVKEALDELSSLILKLAGGEASAAADFFLGKMSPRILRLRKTRLTQILGTAPPATEVFRILQALGLNPKKEAAGWKVTVPFFRFDLSREIDFIEEVVRLTGFGEIKALLPRWEARPLVESEMSRHEDEARQFLKSRGFVETLHTSFAATGVKILNPLSEDLGALRESLLWALLNVYRKNRSPDLSSRYFELRPVYRKGGEEQRRLAG
ncbi:MAG: phenylalanine--tRNA ligase subunit beta, partial [Deltaproteobacteria bacterium]|nr:phenylalanine--tRNA ligase subunit beta [Deltaproteobacteria bacterium]